MYFRIVIVACLLFVASASFAGTASPVGLLTSFGTARVSGVPVQSGASVFPGDVVETDRGAVLTVRGGDSVAMGYGSKVRVLTGNQGTSFELLGGLSRIQLRTGAVAVVASNWTLRPAPGTKAATADVLPSKDGSVSVNVSHGTILARHGDGREMTLVAANAAPALPNAAGSPAPAPPAPQTGSSGRSNGAIVGAYVLGAAAVAIGVAVLATRDDNDEEFLSALEAERAARVALAADLAAEQAARAALAAQLQLQATQLAALQAQATALNTTIATLQAQIAASQASLAVREQQLGDLSVLVTQLLIVQNQINALLSKVASGQALTPAEQALLSQLSSQLSSIQGQLLALITEITGCASPPCP